MSVAYEKTTAKISVTVEPIYLDDQSRPEDRYYVWAYHVRIHNQGSTTVQLQARYWRITDSNGVVQEVQGDGVIGEQPVLHPGESFAYTSGTHLNTPGGMMLGYYKMQGENSAFNIDIPAFSLDSPFQASVRH